MAPVRPPHPNQPQNVQQNMPAAVLPMGNVLNDILNQIPFPAFRGMAQQPAQGQPVIQLPEHLRNIGRQIRPVLANNEIAFMHSVYAYDDVVRQEVLNNTHTTEGGMGRMREALDEMGRRQGDVARLVMTRLDSLPPEQRLSPEDRALLLHALTQDIYDRAMRASQQRQNQINNPPIVAPPVPVAPVPAQMGPPPGPVRQ